MSEYHKFKITLYCTDCNDVRVGIRKLDIVREKAKIGCSTCKKTRDIPLLDEYIWQIPGHYYPIDSYHTHNHALWAQEKLHVGIERM